MPPNYPPTEINDKGVFPSWDNVVLRARQGDPYRNLLARARGELRGPPVKAADGVAWLAKELVRRTDEDRDAVLMVTGEERSGKSTFAEALVLAISVLLNRPFDWAKDWAPTVSKLLDAYEAAQRAETVWWDEAVRGGFAGDTFDVEQIVLTKLLAQAGSRNAILIACIPSPELIALKVRGRRATFWAKVVSRGTKARPAPTRLQFRERDAKVTEPKAPYWGFARSLKCPDIVVNPLPSDHPFDTRYREEKAKGQKDWFAEARQRLRQAEKRGSGP